MDIRLGGQIGQRVLERLARRFSPKAVDWEAVDPFTTSGLRKYFGEPWLERMQGKRVIDFGCGRGSDVVAAALAGASEVVGVDTQAEFLRSARALAERHGVADRCRFVDVRADPETYASLRDGFDFALSVDAFEHFSDPIGVLHQIHQLLAPNGRFLLTFGPPWKHPFGAHLNGWITLPWVHFVFDEPTIFAVRAHWLSDGAKRFEEVPEGLNRMTVARATELLAASSLRVESLDPVPIRALRMLAKIPAMREYTTSIVRAVCVREA